MSMTNAEKQAAWRKRRQEELERLRAHTVEPAPAQPVPPPATSGPFDGCTAEELAELVRHLKHWRSQQAFLRRYEAQKAADEAQRKARLEELMEGAALKPGTYYVASLVFGKASVDEVVITKGPRGGTIVTIDGKRVRMTFSGGRWGIGDRRVWVRQADAMRNAKARQEAQEEMSNVLGRLFGDKNPMHGKSKAELRRIASANHPDKGNPDADPVLYQQAVEAMDALR